MRGVDFGVGTAPGPIRRLSFSVRRFGPLQAQLAGQYDLLSHASTGDQRGR